MRLIAMVASIVMLSLCVPGASASTKSAQKALKAIQESSFKQFRTDANGTLDVAFIQLAAVELQVKNGAVTPKNAVEDAIDALGPAVAEVSVLAYTLIVDVAIAAEPLLAAEPTETIAGFLAGDGGISDAFETKVDKELSKLRTRALKRVRAFAKAVSKATSGDYRIAAVMPVPHLNGAARMNKIANANASDVIFWPTRFLLALAGSSATVANDGRLVFALQARIWVTSGDGKANVYLAGSGPLKTSLSIPCGSKTEFGYAQTKFDNLVVGSYIALFDQDGTHDAVTGEDAFERLVVGVP